MSGSDHSTIRCEDGTEIPFTWTYDGAEAFEWIRDRSHWPEPLQPMELWLRLNGWPGADKVWAEAGMEPPPVFRRFQQVGPFLYARNTPAEPAKMGELAKRFREVAQAHGGANAFWHECARPRCVGACEELAAMPRVTSLRELAELWTYGFHQTFTASALLAEPSIRLTLMLVQAGATDAELQSLEVTQGGENTTQDIDGEIFALAETARRTPAVKALLEKAADAGALAALRKDPGAAAFVAAFDGLVARHATRSRGWELLLPTWGEEPEAPLSLVRAAMLSECASPAERAAVSAARRAAARERALALLPSERHAEFEQMVSDLDGYVSVRENRAYWQMRLSGEVRGVLLRTGAELVASGRLDRADDILFLTAEEIEGSGTADLRAAASDARRTWEAWRKVSPPLTIGTPGLAAAWIATAQEAAQGAAQEELRGMPASRGKVTATARVLHEASDIGRLQKGEVLVCVMTTPAWTPMFAIAGGVITETGAALSHPAITAREYGIPAVVAVQGATTRIRDGQRVTVDGGKGVVSLEA